MKTQLKDKIIIWLLEGDSSIKYQTYRDLLGLERIDLKNNISKEGWGLRLLSFRNENGHWGKGFYQPKWTSSHYTLLDLKNFNIDPSIKEIKDTVSLIIKYNKSEDGGVNPSGTIKNSDVCINGMFLNYAAYFNTNSDELKSVVDFILSQRMNDGGFNCHSNRKGAEHSSLHTTLSVIEGISEYAKNGYKYRIRELKNAESESREFLLRHRLFKSHRTGNIIKNQFIRFSFPSRWYYDILRSMDYFRIAKVKYDERMHDAITIILKKRDKDGKWKLQANHKGRMHFEMETVGEQSRWNTLRALRILKFYGIND